MRKKIRKLTVALSLFGVFAMSRDAMAAQPTLGDLFRDTMNSISTVPWLLSGFGYCTGILLCVVSLWKFKDHVDNPVQTPLSAGLKRFLAGGMFLSLPFMANVVQRSIWADDVGSNTIHDSSNLNMTGLDPDGLDGMVVSFMQDVAAPFEYLLAGFVYILAGGLLLVGINRLTKRMDEGPRGPAGIGTIMTFVTSGVLFAWGDVAGSFTNSLFDPANTGGEGGQAFTKSSIDPNDVMKFTAATKTQLNQVIQALLLFVALVGMIAFIRGWLVLRAFADGQQGVTLAQGLTFLVGGALAINLGHLVNALQATVGVEGITFTN